MSLKEKKSGRTEDVPIQDFQNRLIHDIPEEAARRLPGMDKWANNVRNEFDILLRNLWRKSLETSQDIDERIRAVELTPGPTGPVGPSGPVGPAGLDGANGADGRDGIDGSGGSGPAVEPDPTITSLRFFSFDIFNESTSTYTRYRCNENEDGDPTLYVSEEDLVIPAWMPVYSLDILNETTLKYARYRCRDNGDGNSELYVSDEDMDVPAGVGLFYFDIYEQTTATYTRFRCKDNEDGDSTLYVSDAGLS